MASYENLLTEQAYQFRAAFGDCWFSDVFSNENEAIASFSGNSSNGDVLSAEIAEPLFPAAAVSGGSESDIAVPKRRRGGVPPSGRVAKRKPRGSKRSAATTFIAADPENFRRMVQEVTGVRFGGLVEEPAAAAVDQRPWRGVSVCGGDLPTLDTSSAAFLLDSSTPPLRAAASAQSGGAAAAGNIFDTFCSFPTLESWSN